MLTRTWFVPNIPTGQIVVNLFELALNRFSMFSVPTKVKKTDLPVIPPESEILPSLDDSEDNFSEDLDDDEGNLRTFVVIPIIIWRLLRFR